MLLPIIGAIILAPNVLNFINDVLEEGVLPTRKLIKTKKSGEMIKTINIRAALTESDIKQMKENGSLETLKRGMAVQALADTQGIEF